MKSNVFRGPGRASASAPSQNSRSSGLARLLGPSLRLGTLAVALVTGANFAPMAFAQEQDEAQNIEEVTITGSRIRRDTFNYSAPVTVIDSTAIAATGTTNLGDLMQTLPQTISSINNANTAFSTTFNGLNLTDLRFLDPERTLVLVNGRRFVSGTPPGGGYGVDLNAIPTPFIERIEVLTGGASAIYGSDAIAGVVNIITRTDFEGVEVNAQVGASSEGDKNKEDVTLTLGGEFGQGGFAMMSLGWSSDDEIRSRDRDFSSRDLAFYDQDGDGLAETAEWLGSSFPPAGRLNPPGPGNQFLGDGSVWRSGLADQANSDRFNRAAFRTIFAPVDRRFAAANASYPLTENITFFTELNYSLVETDGEIEPFALSVNDDVFQASRGGTNGMDVAGNLLMPQLLIDNLLAAGVTNTSQLGVNGWVRRLVEFGPRRSDVTRTTLRGLTGFDVALPNAWSLQGYYSYGKTDQDQTDTGRLNVERAAFALDVELAADGQTIQCADATARLQGCVPFNVFGAGTISPAAVAYLSAPGNLRSQVEQEVLNVTLMGDTALELPGGALGFATGLEWREESGAETNPGFNQTGISSGNATAPTNGSFNVLEYYGEVNAPVHDRVNLDAAVRIGDYSSVGNTTTWKVGFDAALHDSVRLRGTISESVRAPNVSDLFAGQGETFANVSDPCNGTTNASTGDVATNCRSIAVIQNRIDALGSFTLTQDEIQGTGGFIGGNPTVDEETADALTIGVVWQPDFAYLQGFSAAVDYYNIEIDDGIATTSRNTVLQRCFDVAPGTFDPTCAGAVTRDPAPQQGSLISVNSGTSNENRFETQGVDIELAYARELGPGTLSTSLLWNYLIQWDQIGIASGDIDANAGEILTPRNRANGSVSYAWNNFYAHWRFRYWGRSTDSNTPNLTDENSGAFGEPLHPSVNEVASYVYNDLSLGYSNGPYAVTLGVNNVGDKQPPILPQITNFGNTGTNTAVEAYDTVGRAWYLSFTYRTE